MGRKNSTPNPPVTLSNWIGLLCLCASLYVLWQFRQILLLGFMAIVLAVALNRLVRGLVERFRCKRFQAVALSLLLVLLGGIILAAFVVPLFVGQFEELLALLPKVGDRLLEIYRDVEISLLEAGVLPEGFERDLLDDRLIEQIASVIQEFGGQVFDRFFGFISNTVTIVLQVVLLLVLTVMFLSEPASYRHLFIRLFPTLYRRRTDEILSLCETALLSWMRGIAINSVFVASACAIGLFGLQIRFVFAHALLAGVFNFIPNIGPAASAIFPLSVALVDAPWKVLAVAILYFVVQNLESYWVSPLVMKQQVALLPALTLLAQLFFTAFLGLLGLLLALPLAVVLKVWLSEAVIKDVLDRCKDGEPAPDDPTLSMRWAMDAEDTATSQLPYRPEEEDDCQS